MKKVLLTVLSLGAFYAAQAQFSNGDPGFTADYTNPGADETAGEYCGAQTTGFYEGAGGLVKGSYSATDNALKVVYESTNTGGIGWFAFAVTTPGSQSDLSDATCDAMGRQKGWGADLSGAGANKVYYELEVSGATTADTLYTYIGSANAGSWNATTSTFNTGGGSTIDKKIALVNGTKNVAYEYSGATWDAWTAKNKVNGFGFELKNANTNLVVLVKKVSVGTDVTQTAVFDKVYKASAASVYVNYDANEATAVNATSNAVLTLKNLSGMTAKSSNGSVMSLSGLNAGLYIMEVNDNGNLSTAKVIVK